MIFWKNWFPNSKGTTAVQHRIELSKVLKIQAEKATERRAFKSKLISCRRTSSLVREILSVLDMNSKAMTARTLFERTGLSIEVLDRRGRQLENI